MPQQALPHIGLRSHGSDLLVQRISQMLDMYLVVHETENEIWPSKRNSSIAPRSVSHACMPIVSAFDSGQGLAWVV